LYVAQRTLCPSGVSFFLCPSLIYNIIVPDPI